MTGDPVELYELDVAARLADIMIQRGNDKVSSEVHVPLMQLLDMVECKIPFNRTVLRYLGLKRKLVYLPIWER